MQRAYRVSKIKNKEEMPISYLVCHMEKYQRTDITGVENENERDENYEGSNPQIDSDRTFTNYHTVRRDEKYLDFIHRRIDELQLPTKVRKDAVLMTSFVIGSDGEFFRKISQQKEDQFFKDCTEFFAKHYGGENIISAVVHKDETTPHLHLNLLPITDGRLCCKDLFNRNALQKLQTDLYEEVGKKYGLKRGKEGSSAKHLSTAEFKAEKIVESAKDEAEEIVHEAEERLQELEHKNSSTSIELYNAQAQVRQAERELQAVQEEKEKVIRERDDEADYSRLLEEAKSGKFALTPKGLRNQIVALTVENKQLKADNERLIKDGESNFKLYQSVRKYEPAYNKAQSAISHIRKTEPLAFVRAYFRSPSILAPFIDLNDPPGGFSRNRLQEIEEEIRQEQKEQTQKSNSNSSKWSK